MRFPIITVKQAIFAEQFVFFVYNYSADKISQLIDFGKDK